ncbi:MAG: beta-propeller fold lactonase family protein [Actinobacteria bacterium]|nr:beta-propeller fold lactonase family protein [Actinomycetota bacterium]
MAVACALMGMGVLTTPALAAVPTVTSFSIAASPALTRASATYSLVFSESVTGLATSDFSQAGTSGIAAPASPWVASAVSGSGTTYTVTFTNATSGGAPVGTLVPQLSVNAVSTTVGATAGPVAAAPATSITLGLPTNSVVPAVTGTIKIGEALACGTGTWAAVPAISAYAYQWQVSSDGSTGWANATGTGTATASYTVAAADVMKFLRCNVTATNTYGASAAASSVATTIVTRPDMVFVASYSATASTAGVTGFAVKANGALVPSVTTTGPGAIVTVAPSRNGRYLYAASPTAIYQYSIGSAGDLTALSPASVAPGVTYLFEVEVSANGRFLYAVSRDDGKVYVYAIGADGRLTALTALTTTVGAGPLYMTFNPAGTVAYVVNRTPATVSQFSVDATTGALTPLTPATVATGSTSSRCTPSTRLRACSRSCRRRRPSRGIMRTASRSPRTACDSGRPRGLAT